MPRSWPKWPEGQTASLSAKLPARQSHAVTAALFFIATVIIALPTPVAAQDGTGAAPTNASDRTYGGGWDCNPGYRVANGACAEIVVPENAYATGRSYGTGWNCRRGFQARDGGCAPIPVPENAFLDSRSGGPGWRCDRGFRPVDGTCVELRVPANAHLDRTGNDWRCDRRFQLRDGQCVLGR
jgi:hypothetical protein